MKRFFYLICMISALSMASCYRMPGEDDCSVIPTTNNLSITGQGNNQNWTPSVQY
ncbi:hypothetical protein [Parachlamydia sp. AcF125]|uniref:hypothetical protein n=1 Tax=Parachlamydia sp. AcF125 TaxID=2795736 RepID=UPI001BC959C3|nr:hypothetical protein [Parachlamydia sp. AcF125]MBS4169185.1 hypothetical protein [Parachlamydia sp. AcF125]